MVGGVGSYTYQSNRFGYLSRVCGLLASQPFADCNEKHFLFFFSLYSTSQESRCSVGFWGVFGGRSAALDVLTVARLSCLI